MLPGTDGLLLLGLFCYSSGIAWSCIVRKWRTRTAHRRASGPKERMVDRDRVIERYEDLASATQFLSFTAVPMTLAAEVPCAHTGLHSLAVVARQRGLDVSAERLQHSNVIGNEELDTARLLRVAKSIGLKAEATTLDWEDLGKLQDAFPAILRLRNGNSMVVVGFVIPSPGIAGNPVLTSRPTSGSSTSMIITPDLPSRSASAPVVSAATGFASATMNSIRAAGSAGSIGT